MGIVNAGQRDAGLQQMCWDAAASVLEERRPGNVACCLCGGQHGQDKDQEAPKGESEIDSGSVRKATAAIE